MSSHTRTKDQQARQLELSIEHYKNCKGLHLCFWAFIIHNTEVLRLSIQLLALRSHVYLPQIYIYIQYIYIYIYIYSVHLHIILP